MGLRLIAGRAGSGKTHACLSQIGAALSDSLMEGPRLLLIVPEQAELQMQRALIEASGVRCLGRCDVLGFQRFARRILHESASPGRVPVSAVGRAMALRYLIGRERGVLREFRRVADRSGFVEALAGSIVELMQEAVAPDALDTAARAADEAGHPSAARLHDMSLLYRAYLNYLGSERVDPEGLLDLVRVRLPHVPWIDSAHIWIDGFAGLSRQQRRLIVDLAARATSVSVSLLMDPTSAGVRGEGETIDDLSLFARTESTWKMLRTEVAQAGAPIEPQLLLGKDACPRFAAAPALAQLERELFQSRHAESTSSPMSAADASDRGSVRLIRARDHRTEVNAAVAAVLDLVQDPNRPMRFRDIAIVVRDLAPYHDLLAAALRAHGIPFFIDRRRQVFHHPLIVALRTALDIRAGLPFGPAMVVLSKTGLSGIPDAVVDSLENYVLAHGLDQPEAWANPWTHPPRPDARRSHLSPQDRAALDELNRWRQYLHDRVAPWSPQYGEGDAQACRVWVEGLYALLERLEITRGLDAWCRSAESRGDLSEAQEHEEVWGHLVKLLDELSAVLGDEALSARQFREIVEAGLADFTLGLVPPTLDQVLVSSIERSRHPPVRAVFVLGLADGQFPARISEGNILGDDERLCLQGGGVELPRTRTSRIFDERMLAYIAVTRPAERLWVSCPETDPQGRPLAPSPFWSDIRATVPEVEIETADADGPTSISTPTALAGRLAAGLRASCEGTLRDSAADCLFHLYDRSRRAPGLSQIVQRSLAALSPTGRAVLTGTAATWLWPDPPITSVTQLEAFAECPFRHFVRYGLRLEERPAHEISSIDLGRLYHRVLEGFVNDLIESGTTLVALTPDAIAERVRHYSRLALDEQAAHVRMEPPEHEALLRRSGFELPVALRAEQSTRGRGPIRPKATERTFGYDDGEDALPALELRLSDGQTVLVRGKIDRIDLVSGPGETIGLVFDYKRSLNRRLRLDAAYHGLTLQLLAYLLVLRECGEKVAGCRVIPGGAFYLPLLGKYENLKHPGDIDRPNVDPLKSFRPRGVLDFDGLPHLDPSLESGWSRSFAAYRTPKGLPGYVEASDAVHHGALPILLDHVRTQMVELARRWLDGDISIRPSRLGKEIPCPRCRYQGVCRIETPTRQIRQLQPMTRTEVIDALVPPATERPA